MALIPNGTPAGSVPLDAIDAGQTADLLASAAAVIGALAGEPAAEAACAGAAPDWDGLADLHVALAVAAADLDDAIAEHTASCTPDPGLPGPAAPPARTLRIKKGGKARRAACRRHRDYDVIF